MSARLQALCLVETAATESPAGRALPPAHVPRMGIKIGADGVTPIETPR
jgi:hypothetical protein